MFWHTAKNFICPRNIAGIFARQLAILQYSPCAANSTFVLYLFQSLAFLGIWKIILGGCAVEKKKLENNALDDKKAHKVNEF